MADDATPWMIGGGIEHSVQVARLVSYLAAGGAEGIVGPDDLLVRALAVPGGSVRVSPGACSVLNRATGAKYEAYATRFPVETIVDIGATGSGASRTDLIVARIEDPYETGAPWDEPTPEDIAAGNAVFRRIVPIPGVPSNTTEVPSNLGYSAIPLARVTLPPSTGTVQQAHITDLRKATFSPEMFGLDNIDNTSDADKPISTATQAALTALTNALAAKLPSAYVRAGSVNVPVTNSGGGSAPVTFSSALPGPVHVVAATRTNDNYIPGQAAITSNGFTLTLRHRDNTTATTTVGCEWIAVGGVGS